jgi:hypothetical protein
MKDPPLSILRKTSAVWRVDDALFLNVAILNFAHLVSGESTGNQHAVVQQCCALFELFFVVSTSIARLKIAVNTDTIAVMSQFEIPL